MRNITEDEKFTGNRENKEKRAKLPRQKIVELYDYIENLLSNSLSSRSDQIKKLEGIWEGVGF
jgi:hypothetical protein